MTATPDGPIAIYYEHPDWFRPLFAELDRRRIPYARVDALGAYVGTPNQTRFPGYFSADAQILKDIKVNSKYTLRFSMSGFNLSNHFNALSVHPNIADPQYGVFFGNYHLMDYELMGGDARQATIDEDTKRKITVTLPPQVSFGSHQWPALITPGPGAKSLADLP